MYAHICKYVEVYGGVGETGIGGPFKTYEVIDIMSLFEGETLSYMLITIFTYFHFLGCPGARNVINLVTWEHTFAH